ncbi:MAG: class I SAM-dependent methyltransferase [Thermoplasmata archaeon]|nr:class I SAM-dependent methyltransferase [Thermoplasmata archaeon]
MILEQEPDAAWVAALAGSSPDSVEMSLTEAQKERRLFAHLAAQHRQEGRSSYIEIDAPVELYALVRLLRPRHVVEVGVSSGVSSAYLLQALARNAHGTLHSIDRPKPAPHRPGARRPSTTPSWSLPPGRSSGWAVPDALRGRWDLRIGDKRDVIPLLVEELEEIGLFVYDVPHDDRTSPDEFRLIDSRLPIGGVVIVDHGPGGGLCAALRAWARRRRGTPIGRKGLGLYGFRSGSGHGGARSPRSG